MVRTFDILHPKRCEITFSTIFSRLWRFPLDFNSFPNILWPVFPMCSTPVCGILCGQKKNLAGAIPAERCGILSGSLFHSMRHHENRVGPSTAWDAIIKEEGYAEIVVDISTFGWYSLVVETSIEKCLCSLSVLYLIY